MPRTTQHARDRFPAAPLITLSIIMGATCITLGVYSGNPVLAAAGVILLALDEVFRSPVSGRRRSVTG